jgi:phosphoglycolate phosphatase-like HAD superfamily hydrolase
MIIIFDYDGVIDNNYELHFQLSLLKINNLTREEHRKLFEGNIHEEREKLKHRDTGYDIVNEFGKLKENRTIDNNVIKVLKELSKRHTLGIISSSSEKGTFNCLSNNYIQELFSFVYGIESGKLKVDKFKKVFSQYPDQKYIFVTDTLGDILEANKVNIPTIAYTKGFHERERLEKGKPYAIIDDFNEIISIVNNS